MPVMTGDVFFPPKNGECNINIDLDSYATKAEVKAITGVDTSTFVKKTDFTKIKESVDKIERDDKKITEDFKKLKESVDGSDVVTVKKDIAELKTKVNKNVTDDAVLKSKVDKNTSDYSDLKTKVDKNTKNYEALNKKIDNVKPGTGLPPGDYVKKTDYDKDKATYVTKTDYSTDKNKLLSTDEYEKDKRDELALKKDLTAYTKKNELNTSVSTFLKSADASNPLKGYVEQKNFKYAITVFLRSPNADNPLHDYAKKSYVDDKVKNIKGGTQDLSGYTKQTDFIAFKDAANKNYATINQLTTLKSDVSKNYTLKKDLDVEIIKKELSVLMGRSFFNGIDGLLNEHIYAPKIKTLKFHSEGGGKVEEWKSVGENPVIIKSAGYKLAPIVDVNDNSFEMKFNGHRLSYGATSKFNSTVTNVYLVYKLNLYKNVELPKYPLVNSLFGAVRVLKKDSNDPEKWIFKGKGIAIDSDGSYSMGAQGLGRNVILFGVDNTNSKHPVNRSHDFMVLGNGNTQLVENVNSIPEKGLAINMTYPGKKFVLSIHYTGSNSLFYVNGVLMTVFKDKYFPDKKDHIGFSLGNISTDFSAAEETEMGLRGNVYEFSVDHKIIKTEDIKNIHAYLMNKHNVDNNFPTDSKKLFH